ncbi:FecR family protein [Flavisphingomonas formosensis]|uniref:FecR family protein n=1 Tax=Flavisphingomonas formosensis TaxID=861534 RepID=UPI0012FB66FF|nr:FecR domain-containing protein [Sphingomonas formosensis]
MSRAEDARDTAAAWIIRRENGELSDEEQAAFDAWLAASDGNKAAYWRLKHSWKDADRVGALGIPAAPAAPHKALIRYGMPVALAASLVAAFWIGSIPFPTEPSAQTLAITTYRAGIGERKDLALADGSHVELNTRSVIRAASAADHREVWLDDGEAYFEVKHDPRRPFVVHAGARTITVLGTKFSVRRDGGDVSVSVLEGRVRIDENPARNGRLASATMITGGMSAISEGRSTLVTQLSESRVENALAWRDGMLSFDRTTLADAAAEFSRYHRRPVIVTDAAAAGIRIGGNFQASNVEAFARLLRDAYGLHVEMTPDAIKISS